MSDRYNEVIQSRAVPTSQDTDNGGMSEALPTRSYENDTGEHIESTSAHPAPRERTLPWPLETPQGNSTDPTDDLNEDHENRSFTQRAEATIQAIENRARTLERRHRDLQAELETEQSRIRRTVRTATADSRTSSTSSSDRILTANNSNRPPRIPLDIFWPRSNDGGASGVESGAATARSNIEFPQMRSVEWLRRNQAHANQEYERYRNEFLERREQLLNGRSENNLPNNDVSSNPGVTSDPNLATTNEMLSASSVIERSASARRDLERALRDYRVARRALRNHYNNEPESPSDQTLPILRNTVARMTDQRDRDRIRARGHSRLNSLEHSDMIVNGIAAAAGVNTDAWRSDDDDTSTGMATRFMELQRRMTREGREPPPLLHTPHIPSARNTSTRLPYLGPTTTGLTGISSGGMRDHYQRLQERRGSSRIYSSQRSVASGPEPLAETSTAPATRQRRRLENDRHQRVNETIDRFSDTISRLQGGTPTVPTNAHTSKAKKALRYLSLLHGLNNNSDKSADLAKELGFRSLVESLAREIEVDLPLRIDELPSPQFSSWLENGMSWTGYQRGGYGKPDNWYSSTMGGLASGPLFDSGRASEDRDFQLRAWRHRERVRAERLERERGGWEVGNTRQTSSLLSGLTDGIETLADVERHLSILLDAEERRLNHDERDGWSLPNPNTLNTPGTQSTFTDKEQHEDQWPVKVTFHEVDWQNMKVFGTMVASHITGRLSSTVGAQSNAQSTAEPINVPYADKAADSGDMETFFDGEIVDFRTHQLETVCGKPGYRIGGTENDVKYWSRIGPFREVIDRNIRHLKDEKAKDPDSGVSRSDQPVKQIPEHPETNPQDTGNCIDQADIDSVVDETMADCLGSRRWLEKAFGEGGWLLMRWKERCFIQSPSDGSSTLQSVNHTLSTNTVNATRSFLGGPADSLYENDPTTRTYTTMYSNSGNSVPTSWGLTIRGFYYVAIHRLTGRIEALYYDSGSQPFQELRMRPYIAGRDFGEHESGKDMIVETGTGADTIGIRNDFGVFQLR